MKKTTLKAALGSLALLPGLAMAAPAVADKADNAFMMICTALVLFMTIPGIARRRLQRPSPQNHHGDHSSPT
jgi:Amt family ammonium transporter